jgi:hypothetical protein
MRLVKSFFKYLFIGLATTLIASLYGGPYGALLYLLFGFPAIFLNAVALTFFEPGGQK